MFGDAVPSDLYVLALPLSQGQQGLALLAFLGGLSAATGMVVVSTLTLSLMIGNHWLAPGLLRGGWLALCTVSFVLATSALYELLEWIGGQYLGDDRAQAFLATQQDPWDAQKDMALALLGALFTLLIQWFGSRKLWGRRVVCVEDRHG